jgi:hypothetical protein
MNPSRENQGFITSQIPHATKQKGGPDSRHKPKTVFRNEARINPNFQHIDLKGTYQDLAPSMEKYTEDFTNLTGIHHQGKKKLPISISPVLV